MMKTISAVAAALSLTIGLSACSYPTEDARVLDNRPTIQFQTKADGVVYVDGVVAGDVANFRAPKSGLRVLPGTHEVTVELKDGRRVTQKVYVTDGVTRTILVQ